MSCCTLLHSSVAEALRRDLNLCPKGTSFIWQEMVSRGTCFSLAPAILSPAPHPPCCCRVVLGEELAKSSAGKSLATFLTEVRHTM